MNDVRPFKAKTYPIPRKHLEEVQALIREMENAGVVEKAATQYLSPLVAVKKPNGKIHVCLDARSINERMQADHAQPPTIDEVLTSVGRKRIFTKLDISQAYWQIPLSERSRQYTGFMFNHQRYVFNRLRSATKRQARRSLGR